MNRTTIITRSAIAVTAALLVAACGSSATSSSSRSGSPTSAMPSMDMSSAAPAASSAADAAGGEPVIHIKDFAFSAPSAPISAGETFTVVNDDAVPHTYETVQKGVFDSGTIKGGGSAEVKAGAAGTYQIKCDFHPSMHGSLTVG